nr:DUF3102 domain-containing protein [uncultured Selenomonas sp.]
MSEEQSKSLAATEEERLVTLATEINTIKQQTQSIMMTASIEIGRRLVEAKAAVGHGGWEAWLKENVNYSQRTASNLIKVFQEYGTGQQKLFGKEIKSQALADLSYTQAVALLGIRDPDERADFLEEHDVAAMTTRELEQAIKERDAAKKEAAEAREKYKEQDEEIRSLRTDGERMERERRELQNRNGYLQQALADSKSEGKENEETKARLQEAQERTAKLEEELAAMKAAPIETATIEVEKIPEEVAAELARLRQEAEERSAQAALQGEGEKQKALFAARFALVQEGFNELLRLVRNMDEEDRDRYQGAIRKLLAAMQEAV